MGLFTRSKPQLVVPGTESAVGKDCVDLFEVMNKNGLQETINREMERFLKTADNYAYFEEVMGDDGNYFGQEFNLRATAGRIKYTYATEPWVFATSSLIARTLSTVPYVVKDKATKEIDENHPLNEKLIMGGMVQDSLSMNWSGSLDLVLGGNYFQVFDKKFQECMHVPVENVSLNLSSIVRGIESIDVTDPQTGKQQRGIPYQQVIHRKLPNPFNPFYGMSLYLAASRPILLDRFKNEFELASYLRGATFAGVIETTEEISKEGLKW
jgi:hypothetical protein